MTVMKTTSETPATEHFYLWRKEKITENPEWKVETRDWFLGMYLNTYPARSFPLMVQLFDHFEMKEQQDDRREDAGKPGEDSD